MAATNFTVEPTVQLASVRCCANGALELLASMENGRRLFVACSRCRVIYPLDRLAGLLERQDGGAAGTADTPAASLAAEVALNGGSALLAADAAAVAGRTPAVRTSAATRC